MIPKLKYVNYSIVCEEVPDEISLVINISGCPYQCKGCHSEYLWEYTGNYISDDLESIINPYKNYITCVCFMGGDQNIIELYKLCEQIKDKYNLKICIYSGNNSGVIFSDFIVNRLIDYLKIGSYQKELGGLDKKTTNQKMYRIKKDSIEDITYKFQKNRY